MKLNEEVRNEILSLYNDTNLKISEISEVVGLSIGTLYKAIGDQKNREYKRKYKLNENYFDRIDTEDKAYFLGLLYADGCNNGGGFYITLQDRDIDILKSFKSHIGFGGDIKFIKNKKENQRNYYMLNISSKYISNKLTDIGCNKNKTINAIFPNIPKKQMNHFIRGVFDGDGSISIDKRNQLAFSIVGNTKIIESIGKILNSECGININIRKPKRYKCDISIYSFGGNKQAHRVKTYLYKNATIYLNRKYLKFIENEK
jgi:hypothetical protein